MQEISLALVREVMDKRVMGLAGTPLPESPAKRRLAAVSAARAVVISLTPGLPPLQRMSIVPRGENMTRTLFMPQVSSCTLPSSLLCLNPPRCANAGAELAYLLASQSHQMAFPLLCLNVCCNGECLLMALRKQKLGGRRLNGRLLSAELGVPVPFLAARQVECGRAERAALAVRADDWHARAAVCCQSRRGGLLWSAGSNSQHIV